MWLRELYQQARNQFIPVAHCQKQLFWLRNGQQYCLCLTWEKIQEWKLASNIKTSCITWPYSSREWRKRNPFCHSTEHTTCGVSDNNPKTSSTLRIESSPIEIYFYTRVDGRNPSYSSIHLGAWCAVFALFNGEWD